MIDQKELLIIKREHLDIDADEIHDWEKYYYENLLLLKKYHVNIEDVKEYFTLNDVMMGFQEITGRLFGIEFREIKYPSVWHPDVTMHEIYDIKNGQLIGRFYLDLHPLNNKYQHAAEYTILSGKKHKNGYQ